MSTNAAHGEAPKAAQPSAKSDVHAKPTRLGRGLSSLMGIKAPVEVAASPTVAPKEHTSYNHSAAGLNELPDAPRRASPGERLEVGAGGGAEAGLRMVALSAIGANRFQPRREIDEAQLKALAASIRASGVMQPVIVRPVNAAGGGGGGEQFELVAGERRWRAAGLAGLKELPAIVRDLSDAQAAEWALVENVQREDLNAMDRAHALKSLVERFGTTQELLGERIGMDRSTIANFIRLTELEVEIAAFIRAGRLSAGHGKALLGAPAGASRVRLAKEAAERGYSVRRVELEAKRLGEGTPKGKSPKDKFLSPRQAVLADIEKRISQSLGTRVTIRTDPTGKRGQIAIEFFDLDQFDGLLSRLGVASM